MKLVIALILNLCFFNAWAVSDENVDSYYSNPGRTVTGGTIVIVAGWDSKLKAYKLQAQSDKSSNYLFATFEQFAKAIEPDYEVKTLTKNPSSLVGKEIILVSELQLMSDKQMKTRVKYLEQTAISAQTQ